ncbi:putative lipoprotein [Myxococcus hansupus]|uniref:Putative lipoprotein n=1 Tax=Pseudomyxococcus hansupus TaxID=1297742 RepID=A0A0H4WK64_9BACT|nr:putative lipoprotein [Myxococcus hansupus]
MLLTWSVGLFGCGKSKAREALTAKLVQRVSAVSAAGGTFHLAELTDFEWDTFHVFTPYIGEELIKDRLGMDWSGAREVYDTECLLVFVKGGDVVLDLSFPRHQGDFSNMKQRRFGQDDAMFTVSPGEKQIVHATQAP